MVITVYLAFNILFIYSIYCFIDSFHKKRKVSKWIISSAFFIYYLITTVAYLGRLNSLIKVLMHIAICFVMGMFYNTSYLKRFLASAFMLIISLASDQLTLFSISLLSTSSHYEIVRGSYLTVIGIIISMSVQFLIVKLTIPLFNTQENDLPIAYWFSVFLIPTTSIYIMYSMNKQYISGGIEDIIFIFITICILLSINILVFLLYNKILKDEALKYENMLLQKQKEDYENQAVLIHEFQNSLHEQRHDMNGYFSTIKGLAVRGDYEKLIDYVETLIGTTKSIEASISTGNAIIDTVLNSKLYLANGQNTHLHVDVEMAKPLTIDEVDLSTILFNLLDNSLEACNKVPEGQRNIWFKLRYQRDALTIAVKNTFNPDELKINNGVASTTKPDKNSHGIGLKRVDKTVEKYNGLFKYGIVQENNEISVFVAEALLYID